MLNNSSRRTLFFHAPQPVSSFVAAVIEPAISVLVFFVVCRIFKQDVGRPELVLALLVCALSFPGHNRFRSSHWAAIASITFSWAAMLAVLVLLGYATQTFKYFRFDLLLTWAAATPVIQWLTLLVAKRWFKSLGADRSQRRKAIIVGAAQLGSRVATSLNLHHEFGTEFLGYFDDRTDNRIAAEMSQRVLGGLADVANYVRANDVADVFITLPLTSQGRILRLLQELQDTTASMYFVPDVFGINIIQGRMRDVNGIPVVGLRESPIVGINAVMKRLLDLSLAAVACILSAPLFVLIALGIRLSSPGPIIQRLHRFGHNGQEILVYQFRTTTAPGLDFRKTGSGGSQTQRARTTPLGQFLRRTSLDALPQFINVLQGRLSIVGPHLLTVTAGEQYRKMIAGYMVRYMVKPGMTGLAQVNGCSNAHDQDSLQRRMVYDLDYLRNWSVGLDLRIIGRAIRNIWSTSTP